MKTCRVCARELELLHFSRRPDSHDGYRHTCRECVAVAIRERRRRERAEREAAREREYQEFSKRLRERYHRPVSAEEHVELTRRIYGDTVADAMLELRRRTGLWPRQYGYNGRLTLSVGDERIVLELPGVGGV